MSVKESLAKKLETRQSELLYRKLQDTSALIDFCSNDYLGFSSFSLTRVEKKDSVAAPVGATASRLLRGQNSWCAALEERAAAFHNAPSALIFNSGYAANLSLLSTVPAKGDTVFYDEFSHASIRDGLRLSKAHSYKFKHNDPADLQSKLAEFSRGQIFVVVEGLYSMDGDSPDLKRIAEICQHANANLIVDEAHSAGVFGPNGKGLSVASGIEEAVFARVITYGKAFGAFGAAILSDDITREYLINFARPFIYTTALPPIVLETIERGYELLETDDKWQTELFSLIRTFQSNCGIHSRKRLFSAEGPIQSIEVVGNASCIGVAQKMQELGFDVRAIVSPTVPAGGERLRVTIHRHNSEEEILRMTACLERVLVEVLGLQKENV